MIRESLLTQNKYSRPGTKLRDVRAVVLHWVENPGTSAEFNRRFFENRKTGKTRYGSAHYIIDEKEIVRCIPEDEVAYHCATDKANLWARSLFDKWPNGHSIGIELCHPDDTGKFSRSVLLQLKLLLVYLAWQYGLDVKKKIIRHYDVTGKMCPKYYVNYPDELTALKWEVSEIRGLL